MSKKIDVLSLKGEKVKDIKLEITYLILNQMMQ